MTIQDEIEFFFGKASVVLASLTGIPFSNFLIAKYFFLLVVSAGLVVVFCPSLVVVAGYPVLNEILKQL